MAGKGWENLPDFSKTLYKNTYFLPGEDYDGWLERVSKAYANNHAHAARMKKYISNYWFHPSTPPSSNAGTDRGLPISCFTKTVEDTKPSIFKSYNESFNLGAQGGGIGTDWSAVRSVNEAVGKFGGESSGIIPFMGISDRSTLAISQGGLRRASEAVYLDVSHPEIEEFINLRKPTGDQNRRAPNLHHGITITNEFMMAVIHDQEWDLISPKTGEVIKTVMAQDIWTQILEVRATLKGEPYLLFIDNVNNQLPEEYKREDVKVTTSNLCTEITLRTDGKHSGVCCLGSINLEYWDDYQSEFDQFIADCTDYLDNILQDFIDRTDGMEGFERARAGAIDERSIGLGVMGFHSLLQKKHIPWESAIAKGLNSKIFRFIKQAADTHNESAVTGICPMAARTGTTKRNVHITAVAPTMSISSLCNVTSSGIEPWVTNAFTKRVNQGSFAIRNKYLDAIIVKEYHKMGAPAAMNGAYWTEQQWKSIIDNHGSVQHLEWMDEYTKDVFKTAFEIDQRWIVELAGDRQVDIDQAQSLNLFIPGGSSVQLVSDLHILAWQRGVKSLYYLRSSPVNRASTSSSERQIIDMDIMDDACIGCT